MMIEFRASLIHGLGGFAVENIRPGMRIIEYVGEKISKRESVRQCQLNNQFIFYLDDQFDLNGDVQWNPARLLNHSCAPNAEASLLEGRIWIVASRLIQAGEEVTFDYGYDLEAFRDYPCACGAATCVGFMVGEAFRRELHSQLPNKGGQQPLSGVYS